MRLCNRHKATTGNWKCHNMLTSNINIIMWSLLLLSVQSHSCLCCCHRHHHHYHSTITSLTLVSPQTLAQCSTGLQRSLSRVIYLAVLNASTLEWPDPESCPSSSSAVTDSPLLNCRYDHVTDALATLHWLRLPHVDFKVAVMTFQVLYGLTPPYLNQLDRVADLPSRRRLWSPTTRASIPANNCRSTDISRRCITRLSLWHYTNAVGIVITITAGMGLLGQMMQYQQLIAPQNKI